MADNIKVVVRVRPLNAREIARGASVIVKMDGNQTILTPSEGSGTTRTPERPRVFSYDHSYWSFDKKDSHFANQQRVYDDLGANLLDHSFEGYNTCIFAYGQTGSGKSYSMMGYGEEKGIIPRICMNLFERIHALNDPNQSATVEVSYLEIYNERVRDLLNPKTKGNLRVREHPVMGPYVEDLAKLAVTSFEQIEGLMDAGNKVRTTAATKMNDTSSRSHAVFSVILTQRRHDVETGMDTEKVSRISLVDLAGSERANSTGAVGARLKEGAEINRSLSTLGRVIAALAEASTGKKKDVVVPFRDSVLTWLLKDALGGNSRTAIIATISPAEINYDETLSTLRYADSAKRIKTHAVVNEDPNARLIRELKEELANLRSKLSGNPDDEGTFDPSLPPEKQFVTIRKPDGTLVKVTKAEIAEQLQASEKLMLEVNQTWEEKLLKTQSIQKERESALEALGISVESGLIGLHSPRLPHLVNLSDDPLLAECLVYNLKPGVSTTVGSMTSDANIKLSGSNILPEHCRFENTDNVVTIHPCEGALVMVNGLRLNEPKRLRSGFRVILGDFHIFRFNNPLEAKAERIRLRHSGQMSLSSPSLMSHSPAYPSSGSDRGDVSRTNSPTPLNRFSRADSPSPFPLFNVDKDDSEWAMARREAALAMIGPDSNVDMLNDDELDQLMNSLQKHKHLRKGRPESRLTEVDDDDESTVSSGQFNAKHDSIATFESLDYDTNLTSWPSPPEANGPFGKISDLKVDLEQQLEQQKSEYEEKLASAKMANVEIEQLRQEKEEMQEMLARAKQEAEQLLQAQAQEFQARVKDIATATGYLTENDKKIAKSVLRKWRNYKASKLTDTLLQYAGLLKESQVLSLSLGKKVVYQFAMITHEPFPISQYEQNVGTSDDSDDLLLYEKKPAVAVKVLDFNTNRIYFWSLSKFKDRLRIMRSLRDTVESPFLGHDSVKENPFVDQQPPQYSLIGITDVPLFAVSQQRSQRMKLDVYSPHTFSIVAELDVSVIYEPAITGEEQSFDIHLHTVQGFNDFLGSEFHVQTDLSNAGLHTNDRTVFVSKKRNLSTGSTLKYDQRFTVDGEEPIHQLGYGRSRVLRFEIFAKPKVMLLESLSSWDELRSHDDAVALDTASTKNHVVNDERHDVIARIEVQEMAATGKYEAVEYRKANDLDTGVFMLHLGVQRRLRVFLLHSSGKQLQFKRLSEIKVGSIREVDSQGRLVSSSSGQRSSSMRVLTSKLSAYRHESRPVDALTTFETSLSDADLMDRKTPPGNRIVVSLTIGIEIERVLETIPFSMDVAFEVHSRNSGNPGWLAMFTPAKPLSTATYGLFELVLTPAARRGRPNHWKRSSAQVYIRGEEVLGGWNPRGLSLVEDYHVFEKNIADKVDLEIAKCLAKETFEPQEGSEEEYQKLLQYCIDLWKKPRRDLKAQIIQRMEPLDSQSMEAVTPDENIPMEYDVKFVPRTGPITKVGPVAVWDHTKNEWAKKFLALRRPYLYLYSPPPESDEEAVMSVLALRLEHGERITEMFQVSNVFAIYTTFNSFLIQARSKEDMRDWIMKIDRNFNVERLDGNGNGVQ